MWQNRDARAVKLPQPGVVDFADLLIGFNFPLTDCHTDEWISGPALSPRAERVRGRRHAHPFLARPRLQLATRKLAQCKDFSGQDTNQYVNCNMAVSNKPGPQSQKATTAVPGAVEFCLIHQAPWNAVTASGGEIKLKLIGRSHFSTRSSKLLC